MFSYQGNIELFRPFTEPMDALQVDPESGADMKLCFRHEWAPYIRGALAVLGRPEIWKGSDAAEVETAAMYGKHLQSLFSAGCGGTGCPGFYPALEDVNGLSYYPSYTWMNPVQTGDGCNGNERVWAITALYNPFYPGAGAGVQMHDLIDDTHCGGAITEVELQEASQGGPNVSLLTWEDCNGLTHQQQLGGSHWQVANIIARWLTVTSLYSFTCTIGIDGPPLCGSA